MWKEAMVVQFKVDLLSRHFYGITERNHDKLYGGMVGFSAGYKPTTARIRVQAISVTASVILFRMSYVAPTLPFDKTLRIIHTYRSALLYEFRHGRAILTIRSNKL
jgi:hypothetical protein